MATLAEGPETRAGVGVGDPLSEVRERYTGVDCGEAVAGEPLFAGEPPKYPWCRTRVGNVGVLFGEDPIESITLTRDRVDHAHASWLTGCTGVRLLRPALFQHRPRRRHHATS